MAPDEVIDGVAVRIIRQLRRIDRKDFAERIGKSESYLRDIEGGRRTLQRNATLITRIAQELEVPERMIVWSGR